MDKDYQAPPNFLGESSGAGDNNNSTAGMVDFMLHGAFQPQPQQFSAASFGSSSSTFDKLCFADVMQFAEFAPKLALNQTTIQEDQETGMDPVYFLKFPVLNDKLEDRPHHHQSPGDGYQGINRGVAFLEEKADLEVRVSGEDENNNVNSVQLQFLGDDRDHTEQNKINNNTNTSDQAVKNNKRKRPRTMKTSEEVESQRMTHIAVERNRRKQMNEHLRVLRSLMPGSYVQRGDQASIIGGAIEFVRELEQLLQCLESQKRRRILGEASQRQIAGADATSSLIAGASPSIIPGAGVPPLDQQMKLGNVVNEFEGGGLREETAENKSCLADVEVKLLGFDAMIKILSRRRPGQLIKTIAALEDLQLCILHTNITTIEQTVLYSFNVKVTSETRFTAEDIASSIQQIFSFIHASTPM